MVPWTDNRGATTVEVAPGVLRLDEPDGRRRIAQHVVHGDGAILIVDAGLPGTPARTILPALDRLGLDPARPRILLVTHPDSDHCGGASELHAAVPGLEVVAHAADVDALGDPERTLRARYLAFAADGVEPDAAALERLRGRLGGPFPIARPVHDGERIELGGVACELVHLPGHSAGHTGVWIAATRTLIAADAVMGRGIPTTTGELLYAPQFVAPSTYRATIERIAALDPALLLCAHEPPMDRVAARAFLAASRAAVDALEVATEDALDSGARTLPEVCAAVHAAYGPLPHSRPGDLVLTVAGIVAELRADGRA